MTSLHFKTALTPDGWRENVRIQLEKTRIATVETGVGPQPDDERFDAAIPALCNLHSHAFQRGMAGLAEVRGPSHDTFWTWREVMYRFALTMTPDDVEAVAAQLYMEMLEAGFARVGEFHYLHHDLDGGHYANIGEMAERIAAAASQTGIALTLLPVFYAQGDFGGAPPVTGQRRFLSDPDVFARLLEAARAAAGRLPEAVVGIAPHSLRAVTPASLGAVLALADDGPIHMHAAEQMREVDACLAWSGKRPVEWLLGEIGLDRRWCLIHATHMTGEETRALAASGAVAGLCPLTEASLGDGLFNGESFLDAGGRIGIGSDSNVIISLVEELRQLETAQRLAHRQRNVLAGGEGRSTGRRLLEAAASGGAQALGAPQAALASGGSADIIALCLDDDALVGRRADQIIDSFVFAGRGRAVSAVWAGGRRCVSDGQHHDRRRIAARFAATMRRLLA